MHRISLLFPLVIALACNFLFANSALNQHVGNRYLPMLSCSALV